MTYQYYSLTKKSQHLFQNFKPMEVTEFLILKSWQTCDLPFFLVASGPDKIVWWTISGPREANLIGLDDEL